MKIIIALTLLFLAVVNAGLLQENMKQFTNFINKYKKSYSDVEFGYRFGVFQESMKRAAALQARETGTARYGVTKFSDLTAEEFRANYLMPKSLHANFKPDASRMMKPLQPIQIPDSFDWNDKGAITAVKDQGQCGSCWAFSATETIESFHFLAGKSLTDLSPQQIVDCDTDCYGCNGGWTQNAFNYVESAGGLDTESSYPYTAQDGTCNYQPADAGAKVVSWSYVTQSDDENAMLQTLAQTGPLSICVDASSWQDYNGGVLSDCGQSVDHCVQCTGYSTQDGTDAWNVRNSWGTDWGVNGYIYLARGGDTCAIGSCVTVVVAQ
jgi:C1A family cysteine protease